MAILAHREMRYGLTATLMDDGYYFADDGTYWETGLWFDEFDVALGYPTEPRQEVPWSQVVWRRDFDHGIALCNPKGNGAQTVGLGGSFRKIAGGQDPAVNGGEVVTSIELADRDGVILLRP